MTKYQIIYQGDPTKPNQEILGRPVDFESACRFAAKMQAESFTEFDYSFEDSLKSNDFYIVMPVFEEKKMNDYLDAVLAEKIESCNAILYRLFPDTEIVFLWGKEIFSDDYFLSIHNHHHERLGYLKVSMVWERFTDNCTINSLQLFRDFAYQVDFGGKGFGFSWFSGKNYKKPDNYQEIEAVLTEIWDILA